MRSAWMLLVAGCGVSFPAEQQVEDLRILELRVSPPEIPVFSEVDVNATVEDLVSLEPNFEPVRLTALAAHPDLDAAIDIEWIRCRRADGTGFRPIPCEGRSKERLAAGTPASVSPIQIAFEDLASSGGTVEAISSLVGDPRDLFSGMRAFFNAEASTASAAIEVDTPRLEGTKRLVIFDPTIVALVLREARARGAGAIPTIEGVDIPTLCTNVSEQEFGVILEYLSTRTPNRAPTYASIEYLAPLATSTVTYDGTPISIAPNQAITFRGRVAPGDKETYRVVDDKCSLIGFTETMAWSWFTNIGELSDQITSEGQVPLEEESETTWRAPPSEELEQEETRVRIWSVLRDGRGGSDSKVIDLVISKGG